MAPKGQSVPGTSTFSFIFQPWILVPVALLLCVAVRLRRPRQPPSLPMGVSPRDYKHGPRIDHRRPPTSRPQTSNYPGTPSDRLALGSDNELDAYHRPSERLARQSVGPPPFPRAAGVESPSSPSPTPSPPLPSSGASAAASGSPQLRNRTIQVFQDTEVENPERWRRRILQYG